MFSLKTLFSVSVFDVTDPIVINAISYNVFVKLSTFVLVPIVAEFSIIF